MSIRSFISFLLIAFVYAYGDAQDTQNNDLLIAQRVAESLKQAGFQNISIYKTQDELVVAYENRVYRFEAVGLKKVIQITIAATQKEIEQFVFITKRFDIPRISTSLLLSDYLDYQEGKLSIEGFVKDIKVTQTVDKFITGEQLVANENSGNYRLELVVQPHTAFEFGSLVIDDAVIHLLGIRPKFNAYLWKGAHFSYEFIVPISNEFKETLPHWSLITPRVISLNQEVRLPKNTFLIGSIGAFSETRYGGAIALGKYFLDNRLLLQGKVGYTGHLSYTRFFLNFRLEREATKGWEYTDLDYLDYKLGVHYWFPKWNLQVGMEYGKGLYNGDLAKVSFTQKFNEVDIGFFLTRMSQGTNYGMNLGIPIFPKKYWKPNRILSVRPARQLLFKYESVVEASVQEYQAQGMYNGFPQDLNPHFIKNQLLRGFN